MTPSRHHLLVRALAETFLAVALIMPGLIQAKENAGVAAPSPDSKLFVEWNEPPALDAGITEMMKTNTLGAIEARIYFVERWEIAAIQKAQALLTMLAKAEVDDQRKLAHAAVKYIANTNYGLVRKHLIDPNLPRVVLSVFMTDTLKRHYEIKLPTLVSLVRIETHPLRNEAQELLHGYLGRDHGTDAHLWEESALAWLKRNPR